MATRLEALGGTSDLLPDETARWQAVEARARAILHCYGYQEIRTPILEYAEVFLQSLGEATEIVQKQMYLFEDRGGRRVALRPEGTASAVRAYLEHGLDKTAGLVKWYYIGPMFRAERPQAGRRRQFHQLGVEVFGSASPHRDAEVLALLMDLLNALGLRTAILKVNNLGCREDRPKMLSGLRAYYEPRRRELCSECQQRLVVNPLRILDCKQPACQALAQGPELFACTKCKGHFSDVLHDLENTFGMKQSQDYVFEKRLVRGLDYYTRTAFEVTHPGLGAQDAIGGGGRYDDLVQQMGGPATPAIGFALGLERVLMALDAEQVAPAPPTPPAVFVATLGEAAQTKGLELLHRLRQAGVAAEGEYEGRSLKRQLESANKLRCAVVLMLGEDELAKGTVALRDMQTRQQTEVAWEACVAEVRRRVTPAAAVRA